MAIFAILFQLGFGYTPMGEANKLAFFIIYLLIEPVGYFFHSPYWISLGKLEYVFTSPAMHTIHHSMDPKHFDKNFGSSLSVYDFLFGTLHKTSKTPPDALKLGLDGNFDWNKATIFEVNYLPFKAFASHLFKRRKIKPAKDESDKKKAA